MEPWTAAELARLASVRASAATPGNADVVALVIPRIAAVQWEDAPRTASFTALRLPSAGSFAPERSRRRRASRRATLSASRMRSRAEPGHRGKVPVPERSVFSPPPSPTSPGGRDSGRARYLRASTLRHLLRRARRATGPGCSLSASSHGGQGRTSARSSFRPRSRGSRPASRRAPLESSRIASTNSQRWFPGNPGALARALPTSLTTLDQMEELAVLAPLLVRPGSVMVPCATAPGPMPRVRELLFTRACSSSFPPQR
jgi:hypothetical protein